MIPPQPGAPAMKRRPIPALLSLLFLLTILPLAVARQSGPDPDAGRESSKRLTAEVLWQLDRVGAPVVSPDGARVVAPVTSYDVESDESETRLWLLAADGETAQRPLTASGATASSPVFSPDGSRLAFISKRSDDEAAQAYVLPMDAPGEAVALTDV